MPYSPITVQDFKDEINKKLDSVQFDTSEDFDRFCISAISLADLSVGKMECYEKYQNTINDIKELLEGFDIYPTEGIIDFEHRVARALTLSTPKAFEGLSEEQLKQTVSSPAFVSQRELANSESKREVKVSRAEKIKEAKEAFQAIIRREIKNRIVKLSHLSKDEREKYIKDHQSKKEKQTEIQQKLKEHKAPEPGSDAHVRPVRPGEDLFSPSLSLQFSIPQIQLPEIKVVLPRDTASTLIASMIRYRIESFESESKLYDEMRNTIDAFVRASAAQSANARREATSPNYSQFSFFTIPRRRPEIEVKEEIKELPRLRLI